MDPNCGSLRGVPTYAFKIPTDAKKAVFWCNLCAGGTPLRARAEFQNRRRLRRVAEDDDDVQGQPGTTATWPTRPARAGAISGLTRCALLTHQMQMVAREAESPVLHPSPV